MIGSYIKGTDLQGNACEGIVIDAIITAVGIQLGGRPDPMNLSQKQSQTLPMPLTAYLVLSPVQTIHIVPPHQLSEINLMPRKKIPVIILRPHRMKYKRQSAAKAVVTNIP